MLMLSLLQYELKYEGDLMGKYVTLPLKYFQGSSTCKTHVQLCMGNCPVFNDLSMIICVL